MPTTCKACLSVLYALVPGQAMRTRPSRARAIPSAGGAVYASRLLIVEVHLGTLFTCVAMQACENEHVGLQIPAIPPLPPAGDILMLPVIPVSKEGKEGEVSAFNYGHPGLQPW